MDEKKWFYTPSGAETVGPVDIEEISNRIADGTIVGDTAVWTKAFGNEWKRADSVSELNFAWRKLESSRIENLARTPLTFNALPVAIWAAYRYASGLLFRSRRFMVWVSLIFCTWMATAQALVNVADVNVFLEKMAAHADYWNAIIASLCTGLSKIFVPMVSPQWVIVVIIFSLITVYVRVKGRLMFVYYAISPFETIGSAWQRTVGRTRSLLIFYTLLECIVNFTLATCLYHFLYVGGFLDDSSLYSRDGVIAALSNPSAVKWLVYLIAIFLFISFIKSFAFHFVEPIIALLNLPVVMALKMTFQVFSKNFAKLISYYLFVLVFRLCYLIFVIFLLLVASIIMQVVHLPPSAMVGGLPLFFGIIAGRSLLLPLDLFFRVVGTRFLTLGKR